MQWNSYEHDEHNVCSRTDDFIVKLTSIYSEHTDGSSTGKVKFIYRGVADENHKLVPTALRTKNQDSNSYNKLWSIYESHKKIDEKNRDNEIEQRQAELYVIQSFYQHAERAGLPLPPISDSNIRNELLSGIPGKLQMATYGHCANRTLVQWPPNELLPILSLAQHYGLPTRLLDWSLSPFVAAYFAASGGLKRLQRKEDPSSLLCIYATVSTIIESYSRHNHILGDTNQQTYPAILVQPPSAENPNLFAQQGVFTTVTDTQKIPNKSSNIRPDRREIHHILGDFKTKNKENKLLDLSSQPMILTLYLPISKAPELLLRLKQLGYSANRIFDGYNGAAKATIEESLLPNNSSDNIPMFMGDWE